MKDGKQWPIGVSASILFVVFACALTIYIAVKNPVEESNVYMQGYHDTDANYNDIINARNSFKKLYDVSFTTKQISQEDTVLKYSILNKDGNFVKDAKIEIILTLPYTSKRDISLKNSSFDGENYVFKSVKLPNPGRWNIMAKITVKDEYRFYNLHADTRNPNTFEY
jgi:hypothetical protein